MEVLVQNFHAAQASGQGHLLSSTLLPESPKDDPNRLRRLTSSSTVHSIVSDLRLGILSPHSGIHLSKAEGNAWIEVYASYFRAASEIVALTEGYDGADHIAVYEAWKEMTNALIRGYTTNQFHAWTIPCLYVAGRYLRVFAMKADRHASGERDVAVTSTVVSDDITTAINKNEKLEDAARVINRIFQLCISDRAPIEDSRKWGLYYATNLLFKTYFKLNSISLSKNILRALEVSIDTPPESSFPRSQISTFHYYTGIIAFLDEDYPTAETHLTQSLDLCHKHAIHNKELILTYLIPCHLLTTHTLPSLALLAPYPRLQKLFGPLTKCIKRGDLAGFDLALSQGEDEFVRRRIYLTLERGRDIAMRNLFRKVFLLGGFTGEGDAKARRTRVPIQEFETALSFANDPSRLRSGGGKGSSAGSGSGSNGAKKTRTKIERDEVECLLANMIYKNLMKGYIAQSANMVVLSKGSAFPGTGT